MRKLTQISAGVLAALLTAGALADQNMLTNGSMELGPGPNGPDPRVPAGWTLYGTNPERSNTVNLTPAGLGYALKAFGDATTTTAGATQTYTGVSPGQSVGCSVSLYSPSFDKLSGSSPAAGITLEFLNQFNGVIGGSTQSTMPFTGASPADTWVAATISPVVAPAGTVKVRVNCKLTWAISDITGAVYWDGASLTVNGNNVIVNGDFETEGNSAGQSIAGLDDWNGFNDQEKSALHPKNGAYSLQIGMNASYSGLYQFMDNVSAGDHIYLLGYAYHPSTDALNGTTRAGLKLEFHSGTQVPPAEEHLTFTSSSGVDSWVPISYSTTVPTGMTIARVVMIYAGDVSTTGQVYIDQASAVRGSAPLVNQLLNNSFENGPSPDLDNWNRFDSNPSSEAVKSCFTYSSDGLCSVLMDGTTYAGVYQEITVTPGESLTVSGLFYSPSGDPFAGTGKAGVKIEWAAGGIPSNVDIGVACSSTNTMGACSPTNTWIPLYIDFTMPGGTSAQAQYTCLVEKGSALSGHVYFDSCEAIVINRLNRVDTDDDSDSDMVDFAVLQRAYAGSGVTPTAWPWKVCDEDNDGDVDFTDATYQLSNMTGPN